MQVQLTPEERERQLREFFAGWFSMTGRYPLPNRKPEPETPPHPDSLKGRLRLPIVRPQYMALLRELLNLPVGSEEYQAKRQEIIKMQPALQAAALNDMIVYAEVKEALKKISP